MRSLKIGILSREPDNYSSRRLKEACIARGHKVRILTSTSFSMMVEEERPQLFYKDRRLAHYDAIVPRIGASVTFYGTAVVRQFEQMGVFSLNSSNAILVSRDKLRSLQMLSNHAIGIPPTAFVREKAAVLPAIERLGGAPVIIKLLEGTQGVGVILADSLRVAEAIVETLQSAKQNVLLQKFVKESRGRDVRAFVVGDRVVAAMRRVAKEGEFRSNVHRGGTAMRVELSPKYERTAIRAAQIMGLNVAGVDMLEGANGPQVMEINSSPGLEGIEGATGLDIANLIVEHIEDKVLLPEVDLKFRLKLDQGFGVAEVPVASKGAFAGRCLEEVGFDAQQIRVLSIRRGADATIPSPHGSTQMLAGDILLCYGPREALKGLVPPLPGKKRKNRALGR